MRASATWVDGTVLVVEMFTGFTTPEKRMNSSPWLMASCFSPDTSRLPLGNTSITVTVMVPVKSLLAAASPLPEKSVDESTDRLKPWKLLPGRPLMVGTLASMLCLRPALADDFFCAWVFSVMLITRVSPR